LNEQQLIGLLRTQDPKSYRELVAFFQTRVINTAFGFVQNQEDAKDVAQEVFVEIFFSIAKFREGAKLSTWIYRITINKSLDFLRHQNRKKRFAPVERLLGIAKAGEQVETNTAFNPQLNLEEQERYRMIAAALQKLPESQRIAFTLNKYEHLGYEEIAAIMKLSVSAIESLLHRAKMNLRKLLHDYYHEKV